MPVQTVQLHAGKTYDVAGSATDESGNAVELTNLDFTPASSAVGEAGVDENPQDNNDTLVTGSEVGASADLDFSADGPDGKKYGANVHVEIVAEDVEIAPMVIAFTARE